MALVLDWFTRGEVIPIFNRKPKTFYWGCPDTVADRALDFINHGIQLLIAIFGVANNFFHCLIYFYLVVLIASHFLPFSMIGIGCVQEE